MPQLSSHAATKTENPTGHNYDPGQPNKETNILKNETSMPDFKITFYELREQ